MGEFLPPKPYTSRTRWAGEIGVLIRARSPSAVALSGAEVVATAGEVLIARATLAQIRRMAQSPDVLYIEAAHRLAPELDKSVPAIGADRLHQEEPRVEGRGVIIGGVDTGIDYGHLDFRADRDDDGFEESSRILFIWDQTETGPFGDRAAVPFGTEYTRAEIEADLARSLGPEEGAVRERDESGHGTHVLGIAAGDGSSSGAGYIGVAPEAELIVVKTSFYSGDVVSGVDYIFRKAEQLGRPCVVNLSLGGHFGPHDGTSNFDLALEGLLGPGRVIVNSAGNEGDERIHIGRELAYRESYRFTFIPAEETVFLNIWYPGDADFQIELEAPVGEGLAQVIAASSGEAVVKKTAAGTVSIDNASGGPNPNNGDKQIGVLLEGITVGQPWTIRLIALSGGGRFDGWPGLASMGEFLQGDSRMTISEPGDAPGVITVGAYTTRYEWRSIDGNHYHFRGASSIGQIAPFSSHGPTRDGRQKPDLSAPGTAIASALAQESELSEIPELVVPDGAHVILQGTSMAAPHVAGTVALMLQAEPRLGPEEAAEKLRQTAVRDNLTGKVPGEIWGFGKLNAERGVSLIGLSLPEVGGRPEVKAGTNPASDKLLFTYAVPPGTKEVRLVVFNVVGKPVFTAELDPQDDRFTWDLVNNEGEPLANGLYIYVIIADGNRSKIHRLVIRR
jgi:subtilisin family serine protease